MALSTRIQVAIAIAVTSAACGGPADPQAPAGPRHVILISLDTVPAAACSLYGYERPTTPFLEELAAEGVVFERHVVSSNNTLKSHASILTGLDSRAHGAYDRGGDRRRSLATSIETVAERFRDAGFETAGFTAHATWLAPAFGIAQGFDTFETDWCGAERTVRRVLGWYDQHQPQRSFVLLHFFDAHSEGSEEGEVPYTASPPFLARFAGERPADYDGSAEDRLGNVLWGSEALQLLGNPWRELPPEHMAWVRGCYDAGLAELDATLRGLFALLAERGVLDDALIVVTGDHGEEFKEHKGFLHHQYYDEVMRVPLIVVLPRAQREQHAETAVSRRVGDLTRAIDLAPTMLELARLPPLTHAQGVSFAPALTRGVPIDYRDTLFESTVLRARDVLGEYKYAEKHDGSIEFFDLDADPGETRDLVAEGAVDPDRLAHARARMVEIREGSDELYDAIASDAEAPATSAEELERLKGLGYLGDDEDDLEPDEDEGGTEGGEEGGAR